MSKRFVIALALALIIVPFALFGCKGKAEKVEETVVVEGTEGAELQGDDLGTQPIEPAQTVATETIPPTANVPQPVVEKAVQVAQSLVDRNKDIQTALKAAGFYSGSIDGKIGPKTKKAIEDFQKAKGLVVDGKVGPKTWAELLKYLTPKQ